VAFLKICNLPEQGIAA